MNDLELLRASWDYTVKVALCGYSSAGKSSLQLWCAEQQFGPIPQSLIEVDFRYAYRTIADTKYRLMLVSTMQWEGSMSERQVMRLSRDCDCVVVMFDCMDINSFTYTNYLISTVQSASGTDRPIIIVANKTDQPLRAIPTEAGEALAHSHGFPYFDISVKLGSNIEELIACIAETAKTQIRRKAETFLSAHNSANTKR